MCVSHRLLRIPNRQFERVLKRPIGPVLVLGPVLQHVLRLRQPFLPRIAHGRHFARADPFNTPRDRNRLPQGLGEGVAPLALGVIHPVDAEVAQIPVPLQGKGGDGPVGGVEDEVCAREADLQGQGGVSEADDAEHEHEGADEGDDAVGHDADAVAAFGRVPVELAGGPLAVLLALDDDEGALRVLDHDVGERDGAGGSSLVEGEAPAGTDSDQGGEEGEEEDGEKSHAVFLHDRGYQDGDGHGAAEEGEEGQRGP